MVERRAGGHREEVGGCPLQAGGIRRRKTSLEFHERGKIYSIYQDNWTQISQFIDYANYTLAYDGKRSLSFPIA